MYWGGDGCSISVTCQSCSKPWASLFCGSSVPEHLLGRQDRKEDIGLRSKHELRMLRVTAGNEIFLPSLSSAEIWECFFPRVSIL